MAERNKKELGTQPGGDATETKAQWLVALEYTRENPTKVAGGAGFLLLCIVIGGLFSLKNMADDRKATTAYAVALQTEDPDLRAQELKKVAEDNTRWSIEARYMMGEAAIEAKAYDKAREAFQEILTRHGDSEYAPMAADGLAFLDENDGKLEEALQGYSDILTKWDDTFTARRQPYNIGRLQEELGKTTEAVASYQQQLELFPESSVARKSQIALDRLKTSNPDLFPTEDEPVAEEAATPDTTVDSESAATPVVEAVSDTTDPAASPAEDAPTVEDVPTPEASTEAGEDTAPETSPDGVDGTEPAESES